MLRQKRIFVNFIGAFVIAFFFFLYSYSSRAFYIQNDIMKSKADKTQIDTDINRKDHKNWQRYFVYESQCKIPYVEPFSEALLKIFKPVEYESCTKEPNLVNLIYDENLQQYILQYDVNIGKKLLNISEDFICCYQEVRRSELSDRHAVLTSCIEFHPNFELPKHIDAILVRCYDVKNSSHDFQQDGFPLIQRRINAQTIENKAKSGSRTARKPSVLMVGIDSMSRINLRRTMPNTFEYLNRNRWYEMQGYNKIGDNTFPNLMAVLAGYNESTARRICKPNAEGGLDRCPLIWQYFQGIGYATAFAEDECGMSTFNYLKKGFKNTPTDHYARPFFIVAEAVFPEKKRGGLHYCLGRRHSAQYIYDYCTDFAKRYFDEPNFGLFWTNTFSHNFYDTASSMDGKTREFLIGLEKSGILDTSIVIFFSDHGMRYGPIVTDIPMGFFEERLPMLFIWLPAWFRKQYPQYANSLMQNKNRLTTNYDLYNTLVHILEIAEPKLHSKLLLAVDCPKCQTLFRPVLKDRNCEDAGIPEHWCTCIPYEVIINEPIVISIAELIIDAINDFITAKNHSALCRTIVFDDITMGERKLPVNNGLSSSAEQTYRIGFTVRPNGGHFQATVKYNDDTKILDLDVESISRLNEYEHHAKCINDKEAKKFCFCEGTDAS